MSRRQGHGPASACRPSVRDAGRDGAGLGYGDLSWEERLRYFQRKQKAHSVKVSSEGVGNPKDPSG